MKSRLYDITLARVQVGVTGNMIELLNIETDDFDRALLHLGHDGIRFHLHLFFMRVI